MLKRSLFNKAAASESQGFTLIELLIVIFIIMLLTVMAMMNYNYVQKQARLDFSADSLVAAIREQQVMARSGKVVSEADSSGGGGTIWKNQCFALQFKPAAGSDEGGLWTGQSDYIGLTAGKIDTCTALTDTTWLSRDIFDSGIKLLKVEKDCSEIGPSPEKLYFKPPFGQVLEDAASGFTNLSKEQFQFELGVPGENDSVRWVQYNVSTGEVKRIEVKDACSK